MPVAKIYVRMTILFLLGLALGWAGATVTRNLEREDETLQSEPASSEDEHLSTYRNERLGFSFAHPDDWAVVDPDADDGSTVVRFRQPLPGITKEEMSQLGPYSFDVVISHWQDIDGFLAAHGVTKRYENLREYLEASGQDAIATSAAGQVGAVDAYGGLVANHEGSNYGVLIERDGIYKLSFTTAETADQLSAGQRLVMESFRFEE